MPSSAPRGVGHGDDVGGCRVGGVLQRDRRDGLPLTVRRVQHQGGGHPNVSLVGFREHGQHGPQAIRTRAGPDAQSRRWTTQRRRSRWRRSNPNVTPSPPGHVAGLRLRDQQGRWSARGGPGGVVVRGFSVPATRHPVRLIRYQQPRIRVGVGVEGADGDDDGVHAIAARCPRWSPCRRRRRTNRAPSTCPPAGNRWAPCPARRRSRPERAPRRCTGPRGSRDAMYTRTGPAVVMTRGDACAVRNSLRSAASVAPVMLIHVAPVPVGHAARCPRHAGHGGARGFVAPGPRLVGVRGSGRTRWTATRRPVSARPVGHVTEAAYSGKMHTSDAHCWRMATAGARRDRAQSTRDRRNGGRKVYAATAVHVAGAVSNSTREHRIPGAQRVQVGGQAVERDTAHPHHAPPRTAGCPRWWAAPRAGCPRPADRRGYGTRSRQPGPRVHVPDRFWKMRTASSRLRASRFQPTSMAAVITAWTGGVVVRAGQGVLACRPGLAGTPVAPSRCPRHRIA